MNQQSTPKPRAPQRFLILLASLIPLALSGCEDGVEIIRVNTEREANEILVQLARRGVTGANKEPITEQRKTRWAIRAANEQAHRSREILVALELPRESTGGFDQMLANTGLIPTAADERAKLMHAVAGELEKTFEAYARVTRARVHVVLPEQGGLATERQKAQAAPSAMVVLKYVPERLGPDLVATTAPTTQGEGAEPVDAPIARQLVKEMVASSVPGLEAGRVTVAYTRAPGLPDEVDRTAGVARGGRGADRTQVMLLAATGGISLICIVLMMMLVREKRRTAARRAMGSTNPGVIGGAMMSAGSRG